MSKSFNRKFVFTISHIFSSEYAHFQHLLRSQFRMKYRRKILPHRLGQIIDIVFLHGIIDDYFLFHKEHDEAIKRPNV